MIRSRYDMHLEFVYNHRSYHAIMPVPRSCRGKTANASQI